MSKGIEYTKNKVLYNVFGHIVWRYFLEFRPYIDL